MGRTITPCGLSPLRIVRGRAEAPSDSTHKEEEELSKILSLVMLARRRISRTAASVDCFLDTHPEQEIRGAGA